MFSDKLKGITELIEQGIIKIHDIKNEKLKEYFYNI